MPNGLSRHGPPSACPAPPSAILSHHARMGTRRLRDRGDLCRLGGRTPPAFTRCKVSLGSFRQSTRDIQLRPAPRCWKRRPFGPRSDIYWKPSRPRSSAPPAGRNGALTRLRVSTTSPGRRSISCPKRRTHLSAAPLRESGLPPDAGRGVSIASITLDASESCA